MKTREVRSLPVFRRLLSHSYSSVAEAAVDACRMVCEAFGVDVALVTRLDGDSIEVVAAHDPGGAGVTAGMRSPLQRTLSWHALQTDVATTSADTEPELRAQMGAWPGLGLVSTAAAPLRDASGQPFGTLCVLHRDHVDLDHDGRWLLEVLAGLLGREHELETSRTHEREARAALADHATDLKESETRFRSLVDEMRDIIVRLGPDGQIVFVNQAWTELTGKSVEETIGDGAFDNVHPDDRLVALEHMQALVAGDSSAAREVRFLARDDSVRWMAVTGRVLCDDDGNFAGFSGLLYDVTERREAQQRIQDALADAEQARDAAHQALATAEEASRAKSEFLSRMSHELRTPLNAILGFGQLLELAELSGEDAEHVDLIVRAGRHLLDLINEVLDVVQVESGRLSLSMEPVAVGDVVVESLDLVRTAAAERGISLSGTARHATTHVLADRQRLKQVLLNLLSNAVKYNRAGGQVRVDVRPLTAGERAGALLEGDSPWLRMSVADTGIGIPADRLDDVFTPFERLGAETTGVEGTGVGLSLTKRLVEALGGRISVTSTHGQGSSFCVDLPAAVRAGDEVGAELAKADVHTAPVDGRARVLSIEDNPSNTTLVQRVLARRPHVDLLVAADGLTGLADARRVRPDLVLLDLHLPGMRGEEVLAELRSDPDPYLRTMPVVIVTADMTAGNERRMLEAGATAFLGKPIDVRALLATVDLHLKDAPDAGAGAVRPVAPVRS
jgi:PAS domain S-box-containing protein